MDVIDALRHFFDRRLGSSGTTFPHLGLNEDVPSQHLINHLVEQTVRRAALDAVAHRSSLSDRSGGAEVSWKHCLMVAALTELRSLELSGETRA